jgi:hypothetical protein
MKNPVGDDNRVQEQASLTLVGTLGLGLCGATD